MPQTQVADQLTRHRELAHQAFDSGNYPEAKCHARSALLLFATTPNSENRQLSRIEWDRAAIERFIRQVDNQQREETIAANYVEVNTIETLVDVPACNRMPDHLLHDKAADADWLRQRLNERGTALWPAPTARDASVPRLRTVASCDVIAYDRPRNTKSLSFTASAVLRCGTNTTLTSSKVLSNWHACR